MRPQTPFVETKIKWRMSHARMFQCVRRRPSLRRVLGFRNLDPLEVSMRPQTPFVETEGFYSPRVSTIYIAQSENRLHGSFCPSKLSKSLTFRHVTGAGFIVNSELIQS